MSSALLFGAVASGALLAGAALGCAWRPPEHVWAAALAFAGGALTSALAFELFSDADRVGGIRWAAGGLAAGAAVFIVVDAQLLKRMRGSAVGLALLAAVTLDGVPENIALGGSLVDDASYALLAAIIASNFPEALGSAVRMREDGRSAARILALWGAAGVLLAVSVVAGHGLLDQVSGGVHGGLLGFAGGAVLAALAITVFPPAYERGGPYVAFSTVAGFLLAYVLAEV